jgi:glutamate synthase domain-containing protein 3
MMQRGMMVVCGDAADGIGDSMYEGTVYVGGEIASLGADCVEGELGDDDRELLARELGQNGLDAGGREWKKLVAGKKLWNFSRHEYDAWRGAL